MLDGLLYLAIRWDNANRGVHRTAARALLTAAGCHVRPPGGGAVEAALSIYLESFAKTLGSREQLAIAEFADALLVIPKTLAVNAGKVGRFCAAGRNDHVALLGHKACSLHCSMSAGRCCRPIGVRILRPAMYACPTMGTLPWPNQFQTW